MLEQAIFDTVRYFDIFRMPVTTTQIWRMLVIDTAGSGVRWGGQHAPSLVQVQQTLAASRWLKGRIVSQWGYYCLHGAVGHSAGDARRYVRARLARHVLAQHKWKITQRVVAVLARLPLVRMIGVTGSLALSNARPHSDLDLFVIVRRGRIWTARLMLALVTQLLGRRRKYWDRLAPDKICLNHYVTDDSLMMSADIQNVYTAVLYTHVVPLAGLGVYRRWRRVNGSWLRRWLMYPEMPWLAPRQYVRVGTVGRMIKRWVEDLLLEPVGQVLEKWAERAQRWTIAQHTRLRQDFGGQGQPQRWGRIVLSGTELAFHPDSKEPAVLRRFSEEYGQGQLL